MMKYPIVAKRITEAMAEKNVRAQDLANMTGINKASISQYVNGTNSPSNLTAAKLGKALGVSPMWLMGMDFAKDGAPIHSDQQRPDVIYSTPGVDYVIESKLGKIMVESSRMNEKQIDLLLQFINAMKNGGDKK